MNAVFTIAGREAISVRMLPYVTNWKAAPDELAHSFSVPAQTACAFAGALLSVPNRNALPTYVKTADGEFRKMAPDEWGVICVEIDSLTKKLTADERLEGENWAGWRRQAVDKLPSRAFVWLDEFQAWFTQTRPLKIVDGFDYSVESEDDDTPLIERQSDRLELHPVMPADAVLPEMPENAATHTKIRVNKTRAILQSFIDAGIDGKIESVWAHIRANTGKDNFPYQSASVDMAKHVDGESITKDKLERALRSLLKVKGNN